MPKNRTEPKTALGGFLIHVIEQGTGDAEDMGLNDDVLDEVAGQETPSVIDLLADPAVQEAVHRLVRTVTRMARE